MDLLLRSLVSEQTCVGFDSHMALYYYDSYDAHRIAVMALFGYITIGTTRTEMDEIFLHHFPETIRIHKVGPQFHLNGDIALTSCRAERYAESDFLIYGSRQDVFRGNYFPRSSCFTCSFIFLASSICASCW